MKKKCIAAILLAVLSLGLLRGGMELCRTPEPLLLRNVEAGLWQVDPDGNLTFLTKAYLSVVVDGVAYLLDNKQGTWCVLADGEVIAQGEPSEEPVWSLPRHPCPFAVIGSMTELDGWLYFLLNMEDNTCCLSRVRTDGTGFEMFPEYDVLPYELLTAGGRVVLRVRTEEYACPAAFDPETKTFAVLSETPADIANRYYVDGDKIWWTCDQETDKAVQCSVPVTGGETETLDLEYVSFVGGGNILVGGTEDFRVMDIHSGKTETYLLPFDDDYPLVADAADWGAIIAETLVDGYNYWLLNYDTGTWTLLTLE